MPYLDKITIQKKIESSGDVVKAAVPFVFGAAMDSYIGKPLGVTKKMADPRYTFYDGILGLAPS